MTPAPATAAWGAHVYRAYLADLAAVVGRGRLAGAVALVLCGTLLESLGLLLLVPLLQLINGAHTSLPGGLLRLGLKPSLGGMLTLFTAMMLLRAWVGRRREIALLTLRLDYVNILRGQLESALARASWTYLVRLRHAEVMHLLFEQLGRIDRGTQQMMQALSGVGLGLASLTVAVVIAPVWTLLLGLPMAALVWALRGRLASAASMGARFGLGQRAAIAAARDFLAGLKLIKAHTAEPQQLAAFARRAAAQHEELLSFVKHQSATRGWFEVGGALLLSALLYAGARWGRMSLPELLLIVLVFSRLLPVLREGQVQAQHLAHMLPAFVELKGAIAAARASAEPEPELEPAPPPVRWSLRHELRLEGVMFCHVDDGPVVLDDLNLALQAGTTTALMGPSGSGKTTLADLALGLLGPTAGSVRIDGMAVDDGAARRRWRASVAYVSQDAYLFPGTLRDNLCWLSGPRSDADLWAALAQADAAGFASTWSDGLDHAVGERGEGLSGGERQRVALARALLCQPELLVLDEVTSQLDADSEGRVLAALDRLRGRVTVLLIGHRPAVARHADRTIVLDRGRVASDSGPLS